MDVEKYLKFCLTANKFHEHILNGLRKLNFKKTVITFSSMIFSASNELLLSVFNYDFSN